MALRTTKAFLLAELESSYGVDPTPTGSSNSLLCSSIEINELQADVVDRTLVRGYLGNYESILTNKRAEITIEVELSGSGTAGTAPKWDVLMQSCGHSQAIASGTSVTYTPTDGTSQSCTIYFIQDGLRKKLTGCRGSMSLNCEAGEIPKITFVMQGLYIQRDDGNAGTIAHNNQALPALFGHGNTTAQQLFGFAPAIQSFTFEQNTELLYIERIGRNKEVFITDRAPSGSITIEDLLVADKNYLAAIEGTSTGNNTFQHGQSAGNIVTFSAPQTDLQGASRSDVDGIQMLNLEYRCIPTASSQDDYSLVLT